MDFQEVIRTRRSIRSFSNRPVPEETLDRILDSARIAPSGNNRQPWKFVVVRDPALKQQIAEAAYQQDFIARAPVLVACCGRRYACPYEPHGDLAYLVDCVIAIDHLVLAARAESVGSCWVGALHAGPIDRLLNLDRAFTTLMLVPLGYPARDGAFTETDDRKPLRETVVKL
ncbi:MAG TPA: nitroreductase family protein [bacterium]|uniref:NADH dehydrogenase n=1 Tax=candidate division TA06 bacterium ADurb.Bin417 TaxID=1852828 RepID=A0A1V5ML66_UNCT6|nr:MAG: NADH dehydrogenase [candidate division TA06 bacterium ADurb.Bin417]HNS48236.1 nitroreductase family protein [bacterium]